MPFINVEVEEETVRTAKVASARAGMLLKKWIERAIVKTAGAELVEPPEEAAEVRRKAERKLVPFEEL